MLVENFGIVVLIDHHDNSLSGFRISEEGSVKSSVSAAMPKPACFPGSVKYQAQPEIVFLRREHLTGH